MSKSNKTSAAQKVKFVGKCKSVRKPVSCSLGVADSLHTFQITVTYKTNHKRRINFIIFVSEPRSLVLKRTQRARVVAARYMSVQKEKTALAPSHPTLKKHSQENRADVPDTHIVFGPKINRTPFAWKY